MAGYIALGLWGVAGLVWLWRWFDGETTTDKMDSLYRTLGRQSAQSDEIRVAYDGFFDLVAADLGYTPSVSVYGIPITPRGARMTSEIKPVRTKKCRPI